jgi:hypothetical protein
VDGEGKTFVSHPLCRLWFRSRHLSRRGCGMVCPQIRF